MSCRDCKRLSVDACDCLCAVVLTTSARDYYRLSNVEVITNVLIEVESADCARVAVSDDVLLILP